MKTELARFSESLLQALCGLPPAIGGVAATLSERADLAPARAALDDAAARLRALGEKLAHQHAHLVIFGPLKSGKSTLMNALAGAYVSEVTSLPGYPALVFVRHASEPGFSATHHSGRETRFADAGELKAALAEAHSALAGQVRAAEQRGETFDPRRHFPEALRRIDVRTPVAALAESGAVLVDTPGLYSRMNFSYDLLTRELRDSAACAVFVVKTDNLFLEQVFAEFNRLLDLFSRIFLVVNVDSGKRDLQPDGTLAPSAESAAPQRIVEAFQALSMAGPLRSAHEQGRVHLHAIDLMQAASARLRGEACAGDRFEDFQRELTDFLNGTDYSREFIRDSLRQSHALCGEVAETCDGAELTAARARQATLAAEIAALDARLAAIERLRQVDWRAAFGEARIASARRTKADAEARAEELRGALGAALDRWYATDESLKELEQRHWNPLLRGAGAALSETTVRRLRDALATPLGGAAPAPETLLDLATVGLDLGAVGRAAQCALDRTDSAEPFRIHLKAEAVPVRRSLGDWLLLRGASSVALRLFGEDRTLAIPAEVKRRRLPARSRRALEAAVEATLREKFPDRPVASAAHLVEHYVEKFRDLVLEGLREREEQARRDRAERQGPCEQLGQIAAGADRLRERTAEVRAAILALAGNESAPEPPA